MDPLGQPRRRVEDSILVRGRGMYSGDLALPLTLHVAFVRSPYAHAHIQGIDTSAIVETPGVQAFRAADIPELARPVPVQGVSPDFRARNFSPLATDTVRYMGEPVAVVVAPDAYSVADAAEAILVEYHSLPVASSEEGGGPEVWPDIPGNLAGSEAVGFGDVDAAFASADVVIEERFSHARAAGGALEPRAVTAAPHLDGYLLTIWSSTQVPHRVRETLASYFDLPLDTIRALAPNVGGGFGVKGRIYPEEYVLSALALRLNRPVQWVATRTEDLMTTCHGRAQIHYARLAARADGAILAIDDHIYQDMGAYTPGGGGVAGNTARHLMGPYHVPALRGRIDAVYTNRVPISALRGGGRPEGIFAVERLLDRLADTLSLDRTTVRRRNLITPDEFPYDTQLPTPFGTVWYDSGRYPEYLDRVLQAIEANTFPAEQARERHRGRYLGLGVSTFIESTGVGSEGARAEMNADGQVSVFLGSPDQGQGHATTFAQTAASVLGVSAESVSLVSGDTSAFPTGFGTFASRMGIFGNNATAAAARALRSQILDLAADMLEISPTDLDLTDGRVAVRGLPARSLTLAQIAATAQERGTPLRARETFQPERGNAWAGGASAAIVEVDIATGKTSILRYVVVHDSGTIINPTIVEGQVEGGVAHGIGNVLYEVCVYTPEGQFLTSTFADYPLPQAGDVPNMEIHHFETPSPFNPLGIKGAGEGGTIGALPTLAAAIEDALSPFGVRLNDMPISAERIVQAVRSVPLH